MDLREHHKDIAAEVDRWLAGEGIACRSVEASGALPFMAMVHVVLWERSDEDAQAFVHYREDRHDEFEPGPMAYIECHGRRLTVERIYTERTARLDGVLELSGFTLPVMLAEPKDKGHRDDELDWRRYMCPHERQGDPLDEALGDIYWNNPSNRARVTARDDSLWPDINGARINSTRTSPHKRDTLEQARHYTPLDAEDQALVQKHAIRRAEHIARTTLLDFNHALRLTRHYPTRSGIKTRKIDPMTPRSSA